MGPGDQLYIWWGHIGLIIEDSLSGESNFYDWGVFSFENENFFLNFALGRLLYTCAVSPSENNINRNIRTNRDVTVYTLDLLPEKKMEILRYADTNMLPENRDYWYHHFNDNCATRIRDIVDLATDGAFKARYENEASPYTLRQLVRATTWSSPFFDWSLNFWMGQGIDKPISVWEEMFLPYSVGTSILDFTYTDAEGHERKLVRDREIVYTAKNRKPAVFTTKTQYGTQCAQGIGLALIALLVLIGNMKEKKIFRVLKGLYQAALGLFFGAAGFILFFLSYFTNHDYTYHNSNIVFVNPLLFAAIPLGIIFAFSKKEKNRSVCGTVLKILWTYVFIGGIITMLIKLLPGFYQQNQPTQVLLMPLAFVLSFFPEEIIKRIGNRNGERGK
jgi:hypothetical protein